MEENFEISSTVICPDGAYALVISSEKKITKVWKEGIHKEFPTKLLIRVSDR